MAPFSPLLAVALNGCREHPGVPRTPAQLASDARAAVAAGADMVHLHAFDDDGRETLAAAAVAAAVLAVRHACRGVPISVSTSSDIEPDSRRRAALVSEWTVLPDLVTANQGEVGIVELCESLLARGVGIEAGLLSAADASRFVRSGLERRCVRVLVEPLDPRPADAVAHAAVMEDILARGKVVAEQVHHGEGVACWAVNARGLERGHGIRTGLEDTPVLPDGSLAADNAALVRAAAAMIAAAARGPGRLR